MSSAVKIWAGSVTDGADVPYVYPADGVDGGSSSERVRVAVHLLSKHLDVEVIAADLKQCSTKDAATSGG
jgi:hypothetical protein